MKKKQGILFWFFLWLILSPIMCEGKFVPTSPYRDEKMFLRGNIFTGKFPRDKMSRGKMSCHPTKEWVHCAHAMYVCVFPVWREHADHIVQKTNIITRYWSGASRFISFDKDYPPFIVCQIVKLFPCVFSPSVTTGVWPPPWSLQLLGNSGSHIAN